MAEHPTSRRQNQGRFCRSTAKVLAISAVLASLAASALLAQSPVDFDGDGKSDFGVVRATAPPQVSWFTRTFQHAPVDFDGDGKSDFVVVRATAPPQVTWFTRTFQHAPVDFDGNGKTNFCVVRSVGDGKVAWFANANPSFLSAQHAYFPILMR